MAEFSPERSEIIRANLINHVAETSAPRRKRALWASGFVLAGVLTGAGVSAGAFAATGAFTVAPAQPSGQPTPPYSDAVTAPPGVIPGAPIVSLLGEPISESVETETEISLQERPDAATHARVTVSAVSPGSLNWGTDPGGDNPSGSWSADDISRDAGASWYDFPLDGSVDSLYLTPSGFAGIVTVQYVTHVPTRLGVNADGQTFGVTGSAQGEPDLVSVIGIAPDGSAVEGYALATQLNSGSPEHESLPSNPEEALERQEEIAEKYPNGWTIPVYASDGTTEVGIFRVGE